MRENTPRSLSKTGALPGVGVTRRTRGLPTTCLAALLGLVLLCPQPAGAQSAGGDESVHVIPLLIPAADVRVGFARIINHSERSGTVRIQGTNEAGRRSPVVSLSMDARETVHLGSEDLENGNLSKGLPSGLGRARGNWRLELVTDLDLEVGAYVRTPDGFLAPVHDVVRTFDVGGETVHRVPIFNPGSARDHVSWLGVSNLTDARVGVTIRGRDDEGEPAPGGEVRLTIPARATRRISAQQLESGGAGLIGRLGDGQGRWRLSLTADGEVDVVSLLQSRSGHLTNLSVSGLRGGGPGQPGQPHPAGSTFEDCAGCPEMVVVPAGSFRMGSPEAETGRDPDEGPVHRVTIAEPFAVGRYEVTFAQWDACHRAGGCSHRPDDQGWGRGNRPVVDVSWSDVQEYVRWLSGSTGWPYRLLSEAEWEYVARAGTTTRYWWGDDVGRNRASCDGCGSAWDALRTAPVGSFSPNAFGLYDVHGNVWERVRDCRSPSYAGAPSDGSAREAGDCGMRGVRGGGWRTLPRYLRSANRGWHGPPAGRLYRGDASAGFRVARALALPMVHTLPLLPKAHRLGLPGVARITNHSDRAGTVHIHGTDHAGRRRGPVILELGPGATRHLDSQDLEEGNVSKGLIGSLGTGTGHWRLELTTTLDIEPSAYIRGPDGLLAEIHAVARTVEVGGDTVHRVPLFNPASALHERSWLGVVNLGAVPTTVTVAGRDDAGNPGPSGEVRFTLAGGAARSITARELEAGGPGLHGRLGDGEGRWQLFVTADERGEAAGGGAIEVMSLVQDATSHISNLSTAARRGFEVVAGGPSTVRPLQSIHLKVPGGLGDSGYTVLLDLSGTGRFPAGDTIEVEGLTTEDDRIVFASPLTRILPDANTSHRLAVRVRREADGVISNVLRYSIDDITSVAGPPGFPSMVLEIMLKSMYASVDDALLNLEAASMQPGLVTWSASRLGVDPMFSDVLAESVLQSLFGFPVTELAPGPIRPVPASGPGSALTRQVPAASADIEVATATSVPLLCELTGSLVGKAFCTAVSDSSAYVERRNEMAKRLCGPQDWMDECFTKEKEHWAETIEGTEEKYFGGLVEGAKKSVTQFAGGAVMGKLASAGKGKLIRDLPTRKAKTTLETMQVVTTGKKYLEAGTKLYRVLEAGSGDDAPERSDSGRDLEASGRMTKQGLRRNFESLKAITQFWAQEINELLPKAEQEFAADPNLDDGARESFSVLVNDVERQLRQAEALDDLEGVYQEEQDPREAIGNKSDHGVAVGASCEPGYREFPLEDGKMSTCVLESLVEENCYRGSRQPSDVDLGGSEACLYYSRDYLQPNGSCRSNYKRVKHHGRWTCRWAELGENQPHAYTLRKTQDEQPPKSGIVTIDGLEIPSSYCVSGYSGGPSTYRIPEERETCLKDITWTVNNMCEGYLYLFPTFNPGCFGSTERQEKWAQCRKHYEAQRPKCG